MNDDEKRYYELSFLVKEENSESAKNLLLKHGSFLFYESPLVKINLAYPIKKHKQAFFGYFHFEAFPEIIKKIEEDLKMAPFLIRYLLVKLPPVVVKKLKSSSNEEQKKPTVKSSFLRKKIMPSASPPPLTNEELEEKIKELQ